jgi:hypothetical protein
VSTSRDRVIVGYSFREHPARLTVDAWPSPAVCALLTGPKLRFANPLSLWPQIWDCFESKELNAESNFTNLQYLPDSFGLAISPTDTCLIAIDLAPSTAAALTEKYELCPLPLFNVSRSNYWHFIGYDIIRPGGMTSGLYAYDWSDATSDKSVGNIAPTAKANQYGLIADLSEALSIEAYIESEITDHAPINAFNPGRVPFIAAGVWIKHRTEDRVLVEL